MLATEIVKEIMNEKGETNASLSRKMKVNNRATIFERLSQKNISVDILIDMLVQLDYQLVIQPITSKVDSTRGEYKVERSVK